MIHKKIDVCISIFLMIVLSVHVLADDQQLKNEFVVTKKKKELASTIKEDIGNLLELSLRQIGKNIQQNVMIQNQIFNKIKDLLGVCGNDIDKKSISDKSTTQLKEYRSKLEIFYKKLEQQQADLQNFLLCFE